MKCLFTCFKDPNNSSHILLDNLNFENKIYLKNDFVLSCEQMEEALKKENFDYIFMFGKKPIIKNKLSIEKFAKKVDILESNLNVKELSAYLKNNGIGNYTSKNAGTSFCNNVYYFTLNYIKNNNLKTKAVFVHLPYIENFDNLQDVAHAFNNINGNEF